MSKSLSIVYKDPERENSSIPFSFGWAYTECWLPVMENIGFQCAERQHKAIWITHSLEDVKLFIHQLHQAIDYFNSLTEGDLCFTRQDYLLRRANQAIEFLEEAIPEWDNIDQLVLC